MKHLKKFNEEINTPFDGDFKPEESTKVDAGSEEKFGFYWVKFIGSEQYSIIEYFKDGDEGDYYRLVATTFDDMGPVSLEDNESLEVYLKNELKCEIVKYLGTKPE